jgi:phospholipase C
MKAPTRLALLVPLLVALAPALASSACSSSSSGAGSSPDAGPCATGTTQCGSSCTATDTDPQNCGTCGNACAKGQSCATGACSGLACNGGTTSCNGACVDLKVDPANCGACGHACGNGQLCSAGLCGTTCLLGQKPCNGKCVDTNADPANCGGCGAACSSGQFCSKGTCGTTCDTGLKACGQSCVDTNTDPANCGHCGVACPTSAGFVCSAGQCTTSNILYVVLIVEENHTFDSYFGKYCTAATGSNPSCTTGPSCCEASPATDPSGASPQVLDDSTLSSSANEAHDRNHAQDCELTQVDNGAMDHYVTGSPITGETYPCSTPINFAYADATTVGPYWAYAGGAALADRYFQPIVGSTSSNDMYLAIAHYQFTDNSMCPSTKGATCAGCKQTPTQFTGRTTIADLLLANHVDFSVYADGYAATVAAVAGGSSCPSVSDYPSDCPWSIPYVSPCNYDPSDIPFQYYAQFADGPHIKDFSSFASDVQSGTLPNLAYVKARTYRNEHPGWSTIGRGVAFVQNVVQTIQSSAQYKDKTLILLTWDEGGGFFDHVPPPPPVGLAYDADDTNQPVPYGTRVPMLALGTFARVGTVSHVQMEHSSIVRFLEYNFLGPNQVGALGHRDAAVNNIGSMLDPAKTGIVVPETN